MWNRLEKSLGINDEIKLFELCVYVGRNLGMTDDALNVRGSVEDTSLENNFIIFHISPFFAMDTSR